MPSSYLPNWSSSNHQENQVLMQSTWSFSFFHPFYKVIRVAPWREKTVHILVAGTWGRYHGIQVCPQKIFLNSPKSTSLPILVAEVETWDLSSDTSAKGAFSGRDPFESNTRIWCSTSTTWNNLNQNYGWGSKQGISEAEPCATTVPMISKTTWQKIIQHESLAQLLLQGM